MQRLRFSVAALVAALAPYAARALADERVTDAGTALSFAVPLSAAVFEARRGDRAGLYELTLTWASTVTLAEALKMTTGKSRPDGSNDLSFPSGHAARAFGAAAHVRERHGLEAAWPLYLASVAVGWTRVQARRHDWVDVAGAAVVAELMARTWTTPAAGLRLSVMPARRGLWLHWSAPL